MFGDVNVKVEDGNLGRSSSTGTGTSIKIGISNVESKSPILISGTMNAKKIKEKVGNTPLADACIDAVEWGASSIYCIPVKAGTAGTIGKITEDQKGYGTFEVKGSPNNAYDIVVEVMDAGECNEGSFRYSLDGGNTFTEEMTIPITGEAELATTGLTAKFTDAEGGDSFMEGDRFTFSTTSPAMSNESVISAVESLINSPLMFEFVHIVADAEKRTDVESLKKKYAASDEKVYTVVTTVQVDDETEDEFTFLFKKPKAASYDRYVKTMSNSVTKASKSFAFDNIIDEQRDMLKETVEEYPAITISLADKLLRMLGLADTTSVKKL